MADAEVLRAAGELFRARAERSPDGLWFLPDSEWAQTGVLQFLLHAADPEHRTPDRYNVVAELDALRRAVPTSYVPEFPYGGLVEQYERDPRTTYDAMLDLFARAEEVSRG